MKGRSHHNRLQSSDPPDDWMNGSWTVDCLCGVDYDDGEEMVNCDECGVWVHTRCSRYVKGDDMFVCDKCKGKNNRNNSEETEVARLLVELPTKTMRSENSHVPPKGPSRQPFRLWTEIPMEERVHVQGVPGGDPALFTGMSPVFSPELWKASGYVPKKFNFPYKEFPSWEKDRDGILDEEYENPVDKGAGVLFSLSKPKESVFTTSESNLVRSRGGEDQDVARDRRKVCLKERRTREREGGEVRRVENGAKKEGILVNSGKRKNDESGIIKDRSGKRKARASDKEVDAKKRVLHSSKTVFTPTSDAKHLAFYGDRAPKFAKGEVHNLKSKSMREKEPKSDRHVTAQSIAKINLKETLSSDICVEDKIAPVLCALRESSPRTADNPVKAHRKEEDDSLQGSEKEHGNPFAKDVSKSKFALEVKETRAQDSNADASLKSEHSDFEANKDHDNGFGSLKVQSSPPKGPTISSDHVSETRKPNGAAIKAQSEGGQSLEALNDSLVIKTDQSSEMDGSDLPEGGTLLHSQRRLAACSGKSSALITVLIPKMSASDDVRSGDDSNAKLLVKPESNSSVRKDRSSHDVKERPKTTANAIPKPSSSGKIPQDSISKKATTESKEHDFPVTSVSGETTVSILKVAHAQNRSSSSGVFQKGEKPHQPNFQTSSKMNQSHVPSVCPPVSSSSAKLSDEELALLLHQELNSSPRVPRVPRVRNSGNVTQLASPTATSMLIKRTSSSGAKDPSTVSRRKHKDSSREGFRSPRETNEEASKRMDRVSSAHDFKRRDTDHGAEASAKREETGSPAVDSFKKNVPSSSAATNSGPSSSHDGNDRNVSSIRSSPRNTSDDDAGSANPIHRTLPGLINEIMSKGRRMTYEELCNAVLPHWRNLRKHNGERYAYASHSQAVLDCLRNRHEWARLVDRGPKTTSSKKRRKQDSDDLEDDDYSKGKGPKPVESRSLESQKDDYPKGKRKARKRRRLALQGRGIKDIRKRRKQDLLTDEDLGTSSNSSEETVSSEDEIQASGARPGPSEASASSDGAGSM